jgi:hypothetical protein
MEEEAVAVVVTTMPLEKTRKRSLPLASLHPSAFLLSPPPPPPLGPFCSPTHPPTHPPSLLPFHPPSLPHLFPLTPIVPSLVLSLTPNPFAPTGGQRRQKAEAKTPSSRAARRRATAQKNHSSPRRGPRTSVRYRARTGLGASGFSCTDRTCWPAPAARGGCWKGSRRARRWWRRRRRRRRRAST